MDIQKGHPSGLYVLFFAEMWERFSYYGMRALLVLYLTHKLAFSDEAAFSVFGAYTALVYATPLFGGMIADRLLGFRKAVILGASLMALGHFAMAFENLLYLALALLIVGNGCFKPNMSSLVGRLYEKDDPRRDSGFTIFYMGVNLGGFLAPIVCGIVAQFFGWHWGFALAGIGMIAGLINFIVGQEKFAGRAEPPDSAALNKRVLPGINQEWAVYIGAGLAVLVAWWLVQQFDLIGYGLNGVGIVTVLGLVAYGIWRCEATERSRLYAAMILTSFSVVFWAFFEQAGSSLNLFTDRNVNRVVFGWEIPTSVFQSVNAIFILLLGPLFSMLWVRLAAAGREPSTPVKFGLGIVQLGLGFGALYYGAVTASSGLVGLVWLILGYMLHTSGELCLSPVGLSMITKLSPLRIGGLMMGVWFLATAYAQYVAALIAKLTGVHGEQAGDGAPGATAMIYGEVFGLIALTAIGVGLGILIVSPLLRKMMKGIH